MSTVKKNLILLLLCVILLVAPFIVARNGEFSGSDDLAEEKIEELNKDYKPWASHIFEPPSGEVESFLFSLQAAIGAGFIGFFVGRKTKKC
ncbi:energy-coupling factor ABC transporter substrate-binding protein [Clostridium fallax]|uniref:Cobalt transport protein CbiN n=1 Tax=Clostridium fallax TaxID=1533 RepID=A0A1M4YS95_9CLOT|nr:energy-coupling factor ABC transporter substrate-binding protein [Clostridium fallax]SHF08601.1 cobalt/nickel transport protein [Clostridium fallax]SQB06207.1 cobalt transport protein CbiN [Clostridium fallax]